MHRDVFVNVSMPIAAARRSSPFARVEVFDDPTDVFDAWDDLDRQVPCSIYQTRAWVMPWIATLGRKAGMTPLFILARGADDRPAALLTMGCKRRGPLRIATWLGGRDANFNMPLMRSDLVWAPTDLKRLFREAADACGSSRPDLFYLSNQPFDWGGRSNPLVALAHQVSPSAAYGMVLPADAETYFAAQLSKETRKKLRKKEAKLAAFGPLMHLVVSDAEAQARVVDTFIAQKLARFKARNIASDFDAPEMRAFLETASYPHGDGIELHALLVGERIVAIYGGAAHAGQWSGMFNAFDTDEEIAKCSPGDLLLMRIIAKACADGHARLDLGVGEARYKTAFCDDKITLFDAVVPVTALGMMAAGLLATRQKTKRAIKANPRLYAWTKRVAALRA